MFKYDIKTRNSYFPPTIEGVVIIDNGIRNPAFAERLKNGWERHRNSAHKFIALFLNEINGPEETIPLIEMKRGDRLSGIITFGVNKGNLNSTQPRGTSHFEIISNQLHIPFMQLDVPSVNDSQEGHWEWVTSNPIQSLKDESALVITDEQSTTISLLQ